MASYSRGVFEQNEERLYQDLSTVLEEAVGDQTQFVVTYKPKTFSKAKDIITYSCSLMQNGEEVIIFELYQNQCARGSRLQVYSNKQFDTIAQEALKQLDGYFI